RDRACGVAGGAPANDEGRVEAAVPEVLDLPADLLAQLVLVGENGIRAGAADEHLADMNDHELRALRLGEAEHVRKGERGRLGPVGRPENCREHVVLLSARTSLRTPLRRPNSPPASVPWHRGDTGLGPWVSRMVRGRLFSMDAVTPSDS